VETGRNEKERDREATYVGGRAHEIKKEKQKQYLECERLGSIDICICGMNLSLVLRNNKDIQS
jgi:hypothetical protein